MFRTEGFKDSRTYRYGVICLHAEITIKEFHMLPTINADVNLKQSS